MGRVLAGAAGRWRGDRQRSRWREGIGDGNGLLLGLEGGGRVAKTEERGGPSTQVLVLLERGRTGRDWQRGHHWTWGGNLRLWRGHGESHSGGGEAGSCIVARGGDGFGGES